MEKVHALPLDDSIGHEESFDCVCGPAVKLLSEDELEITHQPIDRGEWVTIDLRDCPEAS